MPLLLIAMPLILAAIIDERPPHWLIAAFH